MFINSRHPRVSNWYGKIILQWSITLRRNRVFLNRNHTFKVTGTFQKIFNSSNIITLIKVELQHGWNVILLGKLRPFLSHQLKFVCVYQHCLKMIQRKSFLWKREILFVDRKCKSCSRKNLLCKPHWIYGWTYWDFCLNRKIFTLTKRAFSVEICLVIRTTTAVCKWQKSSNSGHSKGGCSFLKGQYCSHYSYCLITSSVLDFLKTPKDQHC